MAAIWAEYIISTPAQFWDELEETLDVQPKASLEQIDLALKSFVHLAARYYDVFLTSDGELDHAVQLLLGSRFYTAHSDRMVANIMDLVETRQSEEPTNSVAKLHILLRALLRDGRNKSHVFKLLRQPRLSASSHKSRPFTQLLIEILSRTEEEAHATGAGSSVEGMIGLEATVLLYEVLRVKRLTREELPLFSEAFILHLFEIVERTRDGDEAYNFTVIRLIIALNEQFMVAGLDGPAEVKEKERKRDGASPKSSSRRISNAGQSQNLVLKILTTKLDESKTFGENLIFILNRLNSSSDKSQAEDLCVSLLILKLLYLLFSTASTSEYFYTNDLRVLVDVFIRELLDLPEESEGLRHTYLRVLHPLMTHTQLRTYPYKREAIRTTLLSLLSDEHIRTVSPTTRRLVERNLRAGWCVAITPRIAEADAEVLEVAEVEKKLATLALETGQGLACGRLRREDLAPPASPASTIGSTLSVNAVADAEQEHANGSAHAPVDGEHSERRQSQHEENLNLRVLIMGSSSLDEPETPPPPSAELVQEPTTLNPPTAPPAAASSSSVFSTITGMARKSKVPPPRPPKSKPAKNGAPALEPLPESVAQDGQPSQSANPPSGGFKARFRRAPPPTPERKRLPTDVSQPSHP